MRCAAFRGSMSSLSGWSRTRSPNSGLTARRRLLQHLAACGQHTMRLGRDKTSKLSQSLQANASASFTTARLRQALSSLWCPGRAHSWTAGQRSILGTARLTLRRIGPAQAPAGERDVKAHLLRSGSTVEILGAHAHSPKNAVTLRMNIRPAVETEA